MVALSAASMMSLMALLFTNPTIMSLAIPQESAQPAKPQYPGSTALQQVFQPCLLHCFTSSWHFSHWASKKKDKLVDREIFPGSPDLIEVESLRLTMNTFPRLLLAARRWMSCFCKMKLVHHLFLSSVPAI